MANKFLVYGLEGMLVYGEIERVDLIENVVLMTRGGYVGIENLNADDEFAWSRAIKKLAQGKEIKQPWWVGRFAFEHEVFSLEDANYIVPCTDEEEAFVERKLKERD